VEEQHEQENAGRGVEAKERAVARHKTRTPRQWRKMGIGLVIASVALCFGSAILGCVIPSVLSVVFVELVPSLEEMGDAVLFTLFILAGMALLLGGIALIGGIVLLVSPAMQGRKPAGQPSRPIPRPAPAPAPRPAGKVAERPTAPQAPVTPWRQPQRARYQPAPAPVRKVACAKCGRERSREYSFYYGTSETQTMPVGQGATKITTYFQIKGSSDVWLCDGCTRKYWLVQLAQPLSFVMGALVLAFGGGFAIDWLKDTGFVIIPALVTLFLLVCAGYALKGVGAALFRSQEETGDLLAIAVKRAELEELGHKAFLTRKKFASLDRPKWPWGEFPLGR
jgi:hypothetical protein